MSYSIPGISSPGPCSADTQPIARPHPATRSRRSAEAGDLAGSAAGDRDQTAHRSSRFTTAGRTKTCVRHNSAGLEARIRVWPGRHVETRREGVSLGGWRSFGVSGGLELDDLLRRGDGEL